MTGFPPNSLRQFIDGELNQRVEALLEKSRCYRPLAECIRYAVTGGSHARAGLVLLWSHAAPRSVSSPLSLQFSKRACAAAIAIELIT